MGMISHLTHKEVVDSLYEASRKQMENGDEPQKAPSRSSLKARTAFFGMGDPAMDEIIGRYIAKVGKAE